MRYAFAWLCLLAACSSPPKPPEPQLTTAALIDTTLAVISQPGSPESVRTLLRDRLLARTDAAQQLMAEYIRTPEDSVARWHLIRLIGTAAERGDQSCIKFLLREALVPDPPPQGGHHQHGIATSDVPEEVMVKQEAAANLVLALIANAPGAADAVNELLREADAWLAKTIAIQMAHDRVMDQQYSSIMADRGFASRFRDATAAEVRERSSATPSKRITNDPPPSF